MVWAPDYVTVDEARQYVTRSGVATDDTELAFAISAASRAVDNATNRQFGQVDAPQARYYTAYRESGRWVVDIDDLMTVTGLTVNADLADEGTYTDTIDEFALKPINAEQEGKPFKRIVVLPGSTNQPNGNDGGVEVTAQFGWTTVPEAVKQATLLQASRFFVRRNAPFGVAGSPETGSEVRLLARVDPDVAVVLSPFIRWWGAA